MAVGTASTETTPSSPAVRDPVSRAFAVLLFTLAAALVANTILGPLGTGAIRYPISGTLLNQVSGLEVVSAGLVAPMTVIAGVLSLRGHRAGAFLGLGPAAYSAYMFLQYVRVPSTRRTPWWLSSTSRSSRSPAPSLSGHGALVHGNRSRNSRPAAGGCTARSFCCWRRSSSVVTPVPSLPIACLPSSPRRTPSTGRSSCWIWASWS